MLAALHARGNDLPDKQLAAHGLQTVPGWRVSMAIFERHVDVDWQGSVMEGKGEAKAGSGAFSLPVTFPNRIGDANGKTSPEELMAAAHGACYAMALNGTLGRKSASADRTVVTATVSAERGDAGIKITA